MKAIMLIEKQTLKHEAFGFFNVTLAGRCSLAWRYITRHAAHGHAVLGLILNLTFFSW